MSFRVRLLPSGKEFTAEKNETVLEAALRSGIALNYNCNNGSCGGCGGRIKSGQVRESQQHDFPAGVVGNLLPDSPDVLQSTFPQQFAQYFLD